MRARGWAAVAVMSGALVACGFLKKPGAADGGSDAEAEASGVLPPADAAASGATPTVAANDAQVTRYPGEKAEAGPLTIEGEANLRTAVGPGADLVLILKHGTEVEKVAGYNTDYLILADDPKDPTRKLLGWVPESAFLSHGTHGGTVATGDAGVHPAIADAGAKTVDAGVKPGPVKPLDVKKTSAGACPPGYAVCGVICRETCKVESDCGMAGTRCFAGFCLGPGAQPCK